MNYVRASIKNLGVAWSQEGGGSGWQTVLTIKTKREQPCNVDASILWFRSCAESRGPRAESGDLASDRDVGKVLVLQASHDDGSQAAPLELFNILHDTEHGGGPPRIE